MILFDRDKHRKAERRMAANTETRNVNVHGKPRTAKTEMPWINTSETTKNKERRTSIVTGNRTPCALTAIDQIRLTTTVAFVPPNPNEFDIATSIFIARASFAQ